MCATGLMTPVSDISPRKSAWSRGFSDQKRRAATIARSTAGFTDGETVTDIDIDIVTVEIDTSKFCCSCEEKLYFCVDIPRAERFGYGNRVECVRASISMMTGLFPSMAIVRAEPIWEGVWGCFLLDFEIEKSVFSHLKETNGVRRTKTVFHSTQNTITLISITLKKQNSIDEVFEGFRTSEIAIFGDMTDEDNGGIGRLGKMHKSLCDGSHLCHATWSATLRIGIHDTHGVDDDNRVSRRLKSSYYIFDNFAMKKMNMRIVNAETMGPTSYLLLSFFTET